MTSAAQRVAAEDLEDRAGRAASFLARLIGRWRTTFSCESMPRDIEGAAQVDWVVDGVSILQRIDTEMLGAPVKSVRLLAYNPLRNCIEAASLEGAGVGIATGRGSVPERGAPFHLVSRVDEQHAGVLDLPTVSVQIIESDDRHVTDIYQLSAGGREIIGRVVFERAE